MSIQQRKDEHVDLAQAQYDGPKQHGFGDVEFIHHGLPEINFPDVDISAQVAGQPTSAPFYINAMTGGSEKTKEINTQLAQAAAATGIIIATGSQSAALKHPELADTYRVLRDHNSGGVIFANVNATVNVDQARTAVDMIAANGLQIHLNAAQELVMPEGDRDLRGLLSNIEKIVAGVGVPVLVKETGSGLSARTLRQLHEVGVQFCDVSGRGGTNFVDIENARRERQEFTYLSSWGQTAVVCLLDARGGRYAEQLAGLGLYASGGVRTPLDVVIALALGAGGVGVAGHFLQTLMTQGVQALIDLITDWQREVRTIMALLGARNVSDLLRTDVLVTGHSAEIAGRLGVDLAALARRSSL